jgi:hypothetical protein
MYSLVDKKRNKKRRLELYRNNKQYITGINYNPPLTREILNMIIVRTNLNIDWEQLWFDLHNTKCQWCGEYFNPQETTRRKYCSEYCSKESEKEKKRENTRKHRLKHKRNIETFYRERYANVGYLPTGFNQVDNPKQLGNSINEHKCDDNDKEHEIILNEFKRLELKKVGEIATDSYKEE